MDKNQATKKGWLTANLEDLEFRRLYERELVAESFIVCIEDAMEDQELTKTELAKRMQCSSANVSRALRKSTNMTIATVVDMALSLNLRVRISLDPLAADECAFVPKVAPTKAWRADLGHTAGAIWSLQVFRNPCKFLNRPSAKKRQGPYEDVQGEEESPADCGNYDDAYDMGRLSGKIAFAKALVGWLEGGPRPVLETGFERDEDEDEEEDDGSDFQDEDDEDDA